MPKCNSTLEDENIVEDPIWHSLTFHHFGVIVSAVFGLIAVAIALFLIMRHATHFLKPVEQKHIIRILFMIPIYATVSFLSYLYYRHAIYFEVLRDCYEAFAIASFFALLCHYIAPDLHQQKDYFRLLDTKNWLWPVPWIQKCTGGVNKGFLRKPLSGLTWFNVIWVAVFQYCFIRVFFTIVSVITQVADRYCVDSHSPAFAHIWVMGFEGLSVSVAMYCLIQFYFQLKADLAPYRPFIKILCIKLVIFFSFWQTFLIGFLSSGPLKATKKIAYPDIKVGIPSMLICVEMAIFATLHLFAFPWKPYDLANFQDPLHAPVDGFSGHVPRQYAHGPLRALASAFNPWDLVKASARGFRWLFVGRRKRKADVSYQTKLGSLSSSDVGQPTGPTFAGNGEAATEAAKPLADMDKPGKLPGSDDEEDTTGLLSHAQTNPYSRQDFYTYSNPPFSNPHAGPPLTTASRMPAKPDGLPHAPTPDQRRFPEDGDLGRHNRPGPGGFDPAWRESTPTSHSPAAAAARPQHDSAATNWDMFAGARPPVGRSPAGRGGPGAAM